VPRETLFHLLLRQPWWVTLLVAVAMFAIAHAIFPPIAPFFALPFAVLAGYIAYRQMRGRSPVNADARLAALRAMSWEEFSATIAEVYRRKGYDVERARDDAYDFILKQDGRITLLQCRRWKVNQVGVGPVRELAEAVSRGDAYKGIALAAGAFSEPARKLTASEPVALVSGLELVELVGRTRAPKTPG
jgi:restriction system protein